MNIAAMRRSSGDAESTSLLNLREFIEGVGGSELYAYENPVERVPLRLDDGIFRSSAAYRLGDISGNGVVGAEDAAFALDIGYPAHPGRQRRGRAQLRQHHHRGGRGVQRVRAECAGRA